MSNVHIAIAVTIINRIEQPICWFFWYVIIHIVETHPAESSPHPPTPFGTFLGLSLTSLFGLKGAATKALAVPFMAGGIFF